MWRWCAYLTGLLLIAVAIAAVPSVMIVESYVGGSAVHGHVEDGRYFVNPGHSQPIVEVSESTWRTLYWLERLWPWSTLFPCWIGIFLIVHGKGPNWKPPPMPPKEMPPWVLRVCMAAVLVTVGATLLFWRLVPIPWATMLFAYILFCISVGTVSFLYSRALRRQAKPERDQAQRFWESIDQRSGKTTD
jgi:fatty acid desaturase